MADANLTFADMTIADAAWYYADPFEKAVHIKNHIAFCKTTCIDLRVFKCWSVLMLLVTRQDEGAS